MRVDRLRENPNPEELATIYAYPHDHMQFPDHVLRVDITAAVALDAFARYTPIADLSCGDAAIIKRLEGFASRIYLGDLTPGYPICGPIEETVLMIPVVDLFILTETIEHLEDPQLVLHLVRDKARALVLSTPVWPATDDNPEHLWAWDREGVEGMLHKAGWEARTYVEVDPHPHYYHFGIWGLI